MGMGVDMLWVGGRYTIDSGVHISSVGVRYAIDRGLIYHD